MREIKFRGRRVDTGEWVYGDLVTKEDGYSYTDRSREKPSSNCWIIEQKGELCIDEFSSGCAVWTHEKFIQVIPKTVGQYTGLKDKNGKEIYEGDVVRCWGGEYRQGYWEHDRKITINNMINDCFMMGEHEFIEVIGNIHDNPELLGGGVNA